MSEEASMRELLAAFIAMEMDIPVVEPAIIQIDHPFLELLKGDEAWSVASKSLGLITVQNILTNIPRW